MTLGNTIAQYRKSLNITQEALAQQLGVTNQAVSKWESDQCCPDVMLLPKIADSFNITIDALFDREFQTNAPVYNMEYPDDHVLRVALYVGNKLVGGGPAGKDCEYRYHGTVNGISSCVGISCGDVMGDVDVGGNVTCGNVTGSIDAGSYVSCSDVGGNVDAGSSVNCGDVTGSVDAGTDVHCGNVGGHVDAGGNVSCDRVEGSVDAGGSVNCGDVTGNVDAGTEVRCGDVGSCVDAGLNVTCGNVGGDVDAGCAVECGNVEGDVDAGGPVTIKK